MRPRSAQARRRAHGVKQRRERRAEAFLAAVVLPTPPLTSALLVVGGGPRLRAARGCGGGGGGACEPRRLRARGDLLTTHASELTPLFEQLRRLGERGRSAPGRGRPGELTEGGRGRPRTAARSVLQYAQLMQQRARSRPAASRHPRRWLVASGGELGEAEEAFEEWLRAVGKTGTLRRGEDGVLLPRMHTPAPPLPTTDILEEHSLSAAAVGRATADAAAPSAPSRTHPCTSLPLTLPHPCTPSPLPPLHPCTLTQVQSALFACGAIHLPSHTLLRALLRMRLSPPLLAS